MLLSNSYLVFPAVVKQQQEEISRNHIPSLFAISVQGGKTGYFKGEGNYSERRLIDNK